MSGPPAQQVAAKPCLHCGQPMRRIRWKAMGARMEGIDKFRKRKFCNHQCAALYRHRQPGGFTGDRPGASAQKKPAADFSGRASPVGADAD